MLCDPWEMHAVSLKIGRLRRTIVVYAGQDVDVVERVQMDKKTNIFKKWTQQMCNDVTRTRQTAKPDGVFDLIQYNQT